MTDKELIQALRWLKVEVGSLACLGCGLENSCSTRGCAILRAAAEKLKSLLDENEHLREVTKMMPKWVSVTERLPHFNQQYLVTACDENVPAGEGIWYSTVVVVAEYYDGCWTWDDSGTEYDLNGLVTHWMPLPEPPSAEEVK